MKTATQECTTTLRVIVPIAVFFLVVGSAAAQSKVSYVDYANTLQGTNSVGSYSRGNTYPSTSVPYPMHSYSAQTGKNGHG